MGDDRSIFDEPHHQSLELLAARALSEGNIALAFKLADRRCRIPPTPEPHCYVLRAEAYFRMGKAAAAIADIARATEIAPENIIANRRMLAWAKQPQQKAQAAFALIGVETNLDVLRKAIDVLYKQGQRDFAKITVLSDVIEGWAIWNDDAPLTLSVTSDGDETITIFAPDAFHPFAKFGRAVSFTVKRTKSTAPQLILLSASGALLYSTRTAGNEAAPKAPIHDPDALVSRARRVTVIVPIYGDYEATRHCLDSLLGELESSDHRAILVDDASPDPRIAKYLARLSARSGVEVLVNGRNLGFIGSVNRALERVKEDDVILLNSDTIVPKGFIARLRAASRLSPDIGTVTPLSNNGEFTSFPRSYKFNPLPSHKDIERIDAIAGRVNAGKIVDIPSGVGFCLYLTRACLNAVGSLSEDFDSGYLEDTDFCLRARMSGFRSVCATSVYVGHAGSKSFAQEKRSLVMRNLRILEPKYPNHGSECEAFMSADPLAPARQAIERVAAAFISHPTLLITGAGAISAIAQQRADALASKSNPILIFEIYSGLTGAKVKISDAAGGIPQSLQFDLAAAADCDALKDFVRRLRPSRIEILDPAKTPPRLIELLQALNAPYDIFIADAGLLGPGGKKLIATAATFYETEANRENATGPNAGPDGEDWTNQWRRITGRAQQILVSTPGAGAFAETILPDRKIHRIGQLSMKSLSKARPRAITSRRHLGLVPVRSSAQEQWFMSEISRRLKVRAPTITITVLGIGLDDIELMRGGNAFVTGAINPDEFRNEVDALEVDRLLICITSPLFGHPILSAAHSTALPTAYFDWPAGRTRPRKGDLPIDPRTSLDDTINAVRRWMKSP